jgi:hypothetical protein
MLADNRLWPLRAPVAAFDTARAHRPLRILSLTGGGYRGLFTAQVLVALCERARRGGPLHDSFDIFGGTSIGGAAHQGPRVFVRKRQRTLRRAVFGTLYDADHLGQAIDERGAGRNDWREPMLSLGTAGADAPRAAAQAEKTGVALSAQLAQCMMSVQERMAAEQAERMLRMGRYLWVNHSPTRRTRPSRTWTWPTTARAACCSMPPSGRRARPTAATRRSSAAC